MLHDRTSTAPAADGRRFCVCVPARDEAERLGRLLDALAEQDCPGLIPIVVALNNTTDASSAVVAAAQHRHAGRLDVRLDEHVFDAPFAHAGSARRRAMELGLALIGGDPRGVLLATDADARPPLDWLRANLRAIDAGADIVGGGLVLDEDEPVPPLVAERRAALDRYWAEVRAIEDEVDPRPWDASPRHGDHTGASLAVTVAAYRGSGGVPAIATGEDVAFVNAVVAAGGRLAHPADVWVRVSPRRDGRAQGGMAAAMEALADGSNALAVPSFAQWRTRAAWRRDLRRRPDGHIAIARRERFLPPMAPDMELGRRSRP